MSRTELVAIRHPKTKQTSQVTRISLPTWKDLGWVEDKPKKKTPRDADEKPATNQKKK